MSYHLHLKKDKHLKKLIAKHGAFTLKKRKNIPVSLCASIMSQQLSTKVASIIHKRFLDLFDGKTPSPEQIINTEFEKLRAIGLSNSKTAYVHNVARFAIEKGMDYKTLNKMENEKVIEYLTQIKGVGRWTAEMLLMFTMAREDVFAVDDYGIQTAMKSLYSLKDKNKKKFRNDLLRISELWSPYRTYACLHLWRFKDGGK
jgi:DNA-3-methyladenine glycosylase II